jgi:hypothetical protein
MIELIEHEVLVQANEFLSGYIHFQEKICAERTEKHKGRVTLLLDKQYTEAFHNWEKSQPRWAYMVELLIRAGKIWQDQNGIIRP